MANNETTTKFKVDISELKKAMTEARKQVAYANSEFKEASSSMDDWSKSSDGISAKLKQLNSNLKSQESVLSEYEKTLDEVKKEYGENSTEAMEWATKLNNQKSVVNKLKKEITGYEDVLTEVSEAEKIAAKTGKEVADVLADVGDEAEDAGDGFTVLKGTIANLAGNAISSLVGLLKDATTNLLGLGEATREYRSQMSKLEAASKSAGYSTDYTKEKYKELYSILGDETAANTAVSNFIAMGAEEKDLNSLLNSAAGIWAKFGDSIPLDGLAEAINHTSQLGSVQGNLADALEWSGLNVDDFNAQLEKCSSETERQKLITDTLNMVYGELGRSYKANNADVIAANQAQADYTDTMAEVGAKVEPITTKLKEGFNSVLEKILELVGDVDMGAFTAKIEEAFKVITDKVLPAIKDGFGWIIEHKDELIAGLAGIAAGFVAFKVVSIIQGVKKAMEGMTIAQYALNLAMSLNPIGIVIALIAGLVAAFVVLWNKSEAFRNFFINMWETIKNTIGKMVKAIADFFSGLWDNIKTIFSTVSKWFNDTVVQPVIKVFTGLWDGLKNGAAKAWEGIKKVFSSVATFFKDTFTKAWTAVKNIFSVGGKIFDGIKDGIANAFKTIVNGIIGGINKVVAIPFNAINSALQTLKDVSIMGLKPFDWIKTIDVPQIPLLAKGGIVNGATQAIIGEAGREAVIPLERNTGWMRTLAADLVREMNMGNSVTGLSSSGIRGGVVNNYNQTINSPKPLNRLDIYRQSKNLLGYVGGV